MWFSTLSSAFSSSGGGYQLQYRRPVDQLHAAFGRGRAASQQKKPAAVTDGQPEDQDTSDTIGFNLGLGFGLQESPLIDSLLERLLRRKQALMVAAAAAAANGYPVPGWAGAGGAGYYPNPAAVFPYAGGAAVGGGPWNRPAAFPYPFVPPVNAFGGVGGWGGGGWGGGVGGWGAGGGGGGGFNPLFDFDNDFGWKNSNGKK